MDPNRINIYHTYKKKMLSPPGNPMSRYSTTSKASPGVKMNGRHHIMVKRVLGKFEEGIPGRLATPGVFAAKFLPGAVRAGTGSRGVVFKVPVTAERHRQLKTMFGGLRNVVGGMNGIRVGDTVAVKIAGIVEGAGWWHPAYANRMIQRSAAQTNERRKAIVATLAKQEKSAVWMKFVTESTRESIAHEFLMKRNSVHLKSDRTGSSMSLNPTNIVPEFYFGGSNNSYGIYVSVTEFLECREITGKTHVPGVAVQAEKALLTLCTFGIAHADAHTGNIVVDSSGRVKVIDFGMSIILPEDLKQVVRKKMRAVYDKFSMDKVWPSALANDIWYNAVDGVGRYVDTVMAARGFPWYHPNGKQIRGLAMNVGNTHGMNQAREAVWGVGKRYAGNSANSVNSGNSANSNLENGEIARTPKRKRR